MARAIFFRCLNKELFSLYLKSLSYMQNQLRLFVLCVISSSGAYRFINFDSSAAKNCRYFSLERSIPLYFCYPSIKSRWNPTALSVDWRNFSYVDSDLLYFWMTRVHNDIECSTDQILSDFLLAVTWPPCLEISTENSSEKENVVAPPCRSYCKAAQQIFTSQF